MSDVSDASGRAIRELSRDIEHRRPRSSASASRVQNNTHNDTVGSGSGTQTSTDSSLNPNNLDLLQSTRIMEDDSHFIPKMRNTAKQYRFYSPPEPQLSIPTPTVKNGFPALDQSHLSDDPDADADVDASLEIGRARNTPSKLSQSKNVSDFVLDFGNSSIADFATPSPGASRYRTDRRVDAIERGSLRKEAQVRRASYLGQGTAPGGATSSKDMHSQGLAKSTRYSSRRSGRDVTGRSDSKDVYPPVECTPPRTSRHGTPKSATNTQQSFMLPDLPNLTEIVSGDGTPNSARTKPRSRYGSSRRAVSGPSSHIPINDVPITDDDKALYMALRLAQDRIAALESEKAKVEVRMQEYAEENDNLRANLQAQSKLRRSDSGLGSTDGEGSGGDKAKYKFEKIKLESTVQSLTTRLAEKERNLAAAEKNAKRLAKERDTLLTQVTAAHISAGEQHAEIEDLIRENNQLRDRIAELEAENMALKELNDDLNAQLDQTHDRHCEDTQKLARKASQAGAVRDRKLAAENQTLKEELAAVKARHEEEAAQRARREAEARKSAEREARKERTELEGENGSLKRQLEDAVTEKERQENEWAQRERELKKSIETRDETIGHLEGLTTSQNVNEELKRQNEELKVQIAELRAEMRADGERRAAAIAIEEARVALKPGPSTSHRKGKEPARSRSRFRRGDATGVSSKSVRHTSHSRHASAPDVNATSLSQEEDEKEDSGNDSTTDLSVWRDKCVPALKPTSRSKSNLHARNIPVSKSKHARSASIHATTPADATSGATAQTDIDDDITYLSFIDSADIAQLRRELEAERRAARRRQSRLRSATRALSAHSRNRSASRRDGRTSAAGLGNKEDETENTTRRTDISIRHRRRENSKSAKIDVESCSSSEADQDEESGPADPTSHSLPADDTKHSRRSEPTTGRQRARQRLPPSDLTSAFLLPDFTLSCLGVAGNLDAAGRPVLSTAAKPLLDKLAPHDVAKCTVCQRILGNPLSPSDGANGPDGTSISLPLPLSQRDNGSADIDATDRPSQPPRVALARVIKALSDEIAHLRVALHGAEKRVEGLAAEPERGMGRRKEAHRVVEGLNRALDARCSWVYWLFDVLEGQKDAGKGEGGKASTEAVDLEGVEVGRGGRGHALDEEQEGGEQANTNTGRTSEPAWDGFSTDDGLSDEASMLPGAGNADLKAYFRHHARKTMAEEAKARPARAARVGT